MPVTNRFVLVLILESLCAGAVFERECKGFTTSVRQHAVTPLGRVIEDEDDDEDEYD